MLFAAAKTAAKSSGSPLIFVFIIVAYGAFYYFYIRPRSRRNKAARQQTRKVEVGDKARTIGGMIGTVVHQDDEAVTLRTASGHDIEFIPSAIAGKHVPPEPIDSDDNESSEHEETPSEGDDK